MACVECTIDWHTVDGFSSAVAAFDRISLSTSTMASAKPFSFGVGENKNKHNKRINIRILQRQLISVIPKIVLTIFAYLVF